MAECEALGVRAMGMEVDLTDRDATEKAVPANPLASLVGSVSRSATRAAARSSLRRTRCTGRRERHARSSDHRAALGHARGNAHARSRHQRKDLHEHLYGGRPAYEKTRWGQDCHRVVDSWGRCPRRYHPYGTSKAAIIHYHAPSREVGPDNINVNSIAPGIIRTGRLGDRSERAKEIALRREGTIEVAQRSSNF